MRRIAALATILTLFWASPVDAAAIDAGGGEVEDDGGDSGPSGPVITDNSAVITVSYRDDLQIVSTQSGTSGEQAKCAWFEIVTYDDLYNVDQITPITPYDRPIPFTFHCWEPDGSPWASAIAGYPLLVPCCDPGLPGGTVVNEYDVAEYAAASINFTLPAFETSPATEQVVGVRT
ncbi:MAG: hypothetical protein AAGC53_22845, partial [Actinomycetota bacterium]